MLPVEYWLQVACRLISLWVPPYRCFSFIDWTPYRCSSLCDWSSQSVKRRVKCFLLSIDCRSRIDRRFIEYWSHYANNCSSHRHVGAPYLIAWLLISWLRSKLLDYCTRLLEYWNRYRDTFYRRCLSIEIAIAIDQSRRVCLSIERVCLSIKRDMT